MQRNIYLLHALQSFGWMRFYIPVLALFYIASNVSFEQFTLIMGVFSLAILLFEIPAGVFADRFGRKVSLIISYSAYALEVFILAFMNGFWPFLIAKIISGIGVSLGSGTVEAMIYDTLLDAKKEKTYKKIYGRQKFISFLVSGIAFIAGSFLFTIDVKLPAKLSLVAMIIGVIITLFLIEPKRHKKEQKTILKNSIAIIKKNKLVRLATFFDVYMFGIISILFTISSVYAEQTLFPIVFLGILSSGIMILQGTAAKYAEKFSISQMNIAFLSALVILCLMIPYFGVLFLLVLAVILGASQVLASDVINRQISSDKRATVLSFKNLGANIIVFILLPLFGYISTQFSLQIAVIGLSVLGFVSVFLYRINN